MSQIYDFGISQEFHKLGARELVNRRSREVIHEFMSSVVNHVLMTVQVH